MRYPLLTLVGAMVLVLRCMDATETVNPLDDPAFRVLGAPAAEPAEVRTPVFGLGANPDGSLLAAETFLGITKLRFGQTEFVAALAGVSGVAAVGRGDLVTVTGGVLLVPGAEENASRLFRISRGAVRMIADLGASEMEVNPDQVWNEAEPESNPFNVVALAGGHVLVSDAAANHILAVDPQGGIDWMAVPTPQLASLLPSRNCSAAPTIRRRRPVASPDEIPAQPVAASIAVGPDGDYYAGELTGFPNPPGLSRIWRIARNSRHGLCPSDACTLVADGFNSIVSLAFGPDGALYVTQLDDDGWLAMETRSGEGPLVPSAGGSVHACDVATGSCTVIAAGLSLPAAVTVDAAGTVWVAANESIPGTAQVHPLL